MSQWLNANGAMPRLAGELQIRWRQGLAIRRHGELLSIEIANTRLKLPSSLTRLQPLIESLQAGLDWNECAKALDALVASERIDLALVLDRAADRGLLEFAVTDSRGAPLLILRPQISGFRPAAAVLADHEHVALSRFALLRRLGSDMILESPLSPALAIIEPALAALLARLAQPTAVADLLSSSGLADVRFVVGLLCSNGLLVSGGHAVVPDHDGSADLATWEFHDLLFHTRSRGGRHAFPGGGAYWNEPVTPPPAVRSPPAGMTVCLPPPAVDAAAVGLADAIRERRSARQFDDTNPITIDELSTLLHLALRVSDVRTITGLGDNQSVELSTRPYPSGGASYELEVYFYARTCAGLEPGFYHYDALEHRLTRMTVSPLDLAGFLNAFTAAMGIDAPPQVMFTFGARFRRVAWKYRAIAYATTLRNVGALYQTLYMAAAAVGLGACAIGNGDIERFARLTGESYLVEGCVGEFAIGRKAAGQ